MGKTLEQKLEDLKDAVSHSRYCRDYHQRWQAVVLSRTLRLDYLKVMAGAVDGVINIVFQWANKHRFER